MQQRYRQGLDWFAIALGIVGGLMLYDWIQMLFR